jgi:hypothetical protein
MNAASWFIFLKNRTLAVIFIRGFYCNESNVATRNNYIINIMFGPYIQQWQTEV